ncbi:MAG TPA: riboflavin kinase, partial [bacterium]|nr:riboflavin kinase [bacterium]
GGVDVCWAVRLEDELAAMSPREFVEDVVSRRLGLSGVAVGENFRFGRGRAGGSTLLKSLGAEAGVEVLVVPPLAVGGLRVSSSLIRDRVERGEVGEVPAFLGRFHSVSGTVEPGDGRGREWGYPTANFTPRQLPPAPGVYAAVVECGGERLGGGLFYRGFRPTLGAGLSRNEAHVFDWDGDLYGREIKVYLLSRIRQDIRFDSVPELLARMRTDEQIARMELKTEKNSEKRNEEDE